GTGTTRTSPTPNLLMSDRQPTGPHPDGPADPPAEPDGADLAPFEPLLPAPEEIVARLLYVVPDQWRHELEAFDPELEARLGLARDPWELRGSLIAWIGGYDVVLQYTRDFFTGALGWCCVAVRDPETGIPWPILEGDAAAPHLESVFQWIQASRSAG